MKKRLALLCFLILGLLAALLAIPRMLWAIATNTDRARIISLALDMLGNAVTNGALGETISSRAGRAARRRRRWGCVLCRCLDWFDKDHCENSIQPQYLQPGEEKTFS